MKAVIVLSLYCYFFSVMDRTFSGHISAAFTKKPANHWVSFTGNGAQAQV